MKNIILLMFFGVLSANAQFTIVDSVSAHNLYAVHFPDDTLGYAVGQRGADGVILKTVDKGQNWLVLDTFHLKIKWVYFFNSLHGIIASGRVAAKGNSRVYITADGGVTWRTDSLPSVISIHDLVSINDTVYISASVGMGVNLLLSSVDSGQTWGTVYHDTIGFLQDIFFVNGAIGYTRHYTHGFYKTINRGETWTKISNIPWSEIQGGFNFVNEDTGFVGGGYNPSFAKTLDGGQSWQNILDNSGSMPYNKFISIFDKTVYAGGDKNFRSNNLGGSWVEIQTTPVINDLYLFDENSGVAVCENGAIYLLDYDGMSSDKYNLDHKIKLFPNPAKGNIAIEIAEGVSVEKIEIINNDGKPLSLVEHENNIVDVGVLPSGTYFIKVYTDKGVVTRKVIVNK